MTIDLKTIVSLELIQNLHNAKSRESLYGLLNDTLTPMGARLLRATILQPSIQRVKLTARYNAVEDLSTKEDMFTSVRQALKGFIDADKVLSSVGILYSQNDTILSHYSDYPCSDEQTVQYVEQSVNNVIMLKTYVFSIKKIYQALRAADSDLLMTIREVHLFSSEESIQANLSSYASPQDIVPLNN